MTSRRALVGAAVLVAWLAGLGLLVRREYFRPQLERLAEAALRVTPGAVFYGVMQGDRQIGFASSTIDTARTSIGVSDYFVADLPVGGKARRATARTTVRLSRALSVQDFDLALETEGPPIHAFGHVVGDSALTLVVATGATKPDTQHVPLAGPILLPTLLPLAVALGERPKVGKRYVLPVFDPTSMSPKNVALDVRAESLFVVNDSAVFDSSASRWRGVTPDTLHAWQLTAETSGGFTGWVDEQGRIVQTSELGFRLDRLPYEVAFDNWQLDSTRFDVTSDRDVLETTAIGADKRMTGRVTALRLRLTGVDLGGFDLAGGRQQLSHDTLTIAREPDRLLAASYTLPVLHPLDTLDTRGEPLLEAGDPTLVRLAGRIAGGTRDPRVAVERLVAWVHDSIAPRVTLGVPDALAVLRARSGDCNEHTQLFVALARSLRIPARIAAGLAYVDGKFYYHVWPEVRLGDWVAVDPTFGQVPADAAHVRFVEGGLTRQEELLRLMGQLRIDVLSSTSGATSARP